MHSIIQNYSTPRGKLIQFFNIQMQSNFLNSLLITKPWSEEGLSVKFRSVMSPCEVYMDEKLDGFIYQKQFKPTVFGQ